MESLSQQQRRFFLPRATNKSHRCVFIRGGEIAAVEFLSGDSDEEVMAQGKALFWQRIPNGYEGFEVWDGTRLICQYPQDCPAEDSPN